MQKGSEAEEESIGRHMWTDSLRGEEQEVCERSKKGSAMTRRSGRRERMRATERESHRLLPMGCFLK